MRFLTALFRILVGTLFIFSGLIKANDPLGFSYKLDEYFTVFGTEFMIPFSLVLAIFICAYEIIFGFTLLFGTQATLTLWALLLMIIFFTFLTFYSAYYNKVTECGCFGDAITLTPWQSFWKDVILGGMILILLFGKKHIRPLLKGMLAKILVVLVALFSVLFPVYTYNYLPIIDFRPYAIGTNIPKAMKPIKEEKVKIYLLYKNKHTGEIKKYPADNYPWNDSVWVANWEFIDQEKEIIEKGIPAPIQDFSIVSVKDGADYTEDILSAPGYYFLLVMYDLHKTNRKAMAQINDFVQLCKADNIPFIALTASAEQIEAFKKETGADFDFYLTDQTTLKTMIRSNPGLILLREGTVIDMWHHNRFPFYSTIKEKYLKY